jgi:hypothetical protein
MEITNRTLDNIKVVFKSLTILLFVLLYSFAIHAGFHLVGLRPVQKLEPEKNIPVGVKIQSIKEIYTHIKENTVNKISTELIENAGYNLLLENTTLIKFEAVIIEHDNKLMQPSSDILTFDKNGDIRHLTKKGESIYKTIDEAINEMFDLSDI